MKKRIFILILCLLMVVGLFTACGNSGSPRIEPTPGVWDGYVFTSEYMGFHFVLPPGWNVAPEAVFAQAMGSGTLHMMADSPTGAIVIFYSRNRNVTGRRPTFEEMMRRIVEEAPESSIRAIPDSVGTVTLGNYEWDFFDTEEDLFGMTISGRYLFNFQGAFLRRIMISSTPENGESFDDILAWFVGLDEPLPER